MDKKTNVVQTLGGFFDRHLVEYVYDPLAQKAHLVVRFRDWTLNGLMDSVEIDGVRYLPMDPGKALRLDAYLFPLRVGNLEQSDYDLAMQITEHIGRFVLISQEAREFLACYVMLTWLYDMFPALPYVQVIGRTGTGKSELLRRVGMLCYRKLNVSSANNIISILRLHKLYRGAMLVDEADLAGESGMLDDLVRVLNMGSMSTGHIVRMVDEIGDDGETRYYPELFSCYGPKLIAMRAPFADASLRSRCIELYLRDTSVAELKKAGVPLFVTPEALWANGVEIQNNLLAWRLCRWQADFEMTDDLCDPTMSGHMNQLTMVFRAMAKVSGDARFGALVGRAIAAVCKKGVVLA